MKFDSKRRFYWLALAFIFLQVTACGPGKRDGIPVVLVFSKTEGFRHSSIEKGAQTLIKLGQEKGFRVDTTENAAIFNDDSLRRYSAVIFLNTTGDILNPAQEAAFERYIQAGGGFVGIHSATDTEYDWRWYGRLVGAYFNDHPAIQEARLVRKADPEFPGLDSLPEEWRHRDEWYNFREAPKHVNVLVSLDESTYKGGHNGEHPITWYHEYDGGRAFYTGLGHTEDSYDSPEMLQLLYSGISYAIGDNKELDYSKATTLLPPDADRFGKVVLAGGLDEPTELTILPGNNILIAERKGGIKYYDAESDTLTEVARMGVYSKTQVPNVNVETGLMGIQADPDYAKNNWVYVFYSPADTSVDRLSRFKFAEGKWDMASEQVILDVATDRDICCHTGGSIAFDSQGNLFLSTGDNSTPFNEINPKTGKPFGINLHGFAPLDDRPGFKQYDGRRAPGNTNDLRGKILRIKVNEDGSYSIPEGNLFEEGNPKARPEIYVMGNRNPYRISVDRKTGFLYWGEVGPDAQNDSLGTRGPRGYDEVNQARKAGNFGWPYHIGNNYAYWQYDYNTGESQFQFDPQKPLNNSRNNTGLQELPPAQPAFIWYPYARSKEFPILGTGGRTAMAGPVYYTEYYPKETRLPEYFNGKLFIYEWIRNWIMAVTMDENGDLLRIEPFMPETKFFNISDMEVGYDGRVYLIEYGTGWFSKNENSSLSVITYNGGNRPPLAEFSIDRTSGKTPLSVKLSAEGSKDPDGDALRYTWFLNEQELGTSEVPEWTANLDKPGQYQLSVKVSDGKGGEVRSPALSLVAGNSRPEVGIELEGNSQYYFPGSPVRYSVTVRDAEDGSLESNPDFKVLVQKDYLNSPDKAATTLGHQQFTDPALEAQAVMSTTDCAACHKLDEASVGPTFMQVAERYKDKEDVVNYLAKKIIGGGSGVWGEVAMPAHPGLSQADARKIAAWIKGLGEGETGEKSLPTKGSFVPSREFKLTDEGMVLLFASYTDKGAEGSLALTGNATVQLQSPFLPAHEARTLDGATKGNHEGRPYTLVNAPEAVLGFGPTDLKEVRRASLQFVPLAASAEGWTFQLETGPAASPRILAEGDFGKNAAAMKPASVSFRLKDAGEKYEELRIRVRGKEGAQVALLGLEWLP